MIKVLFKAFDILEYVIGCGGRPVLPQDIVKALDLNQPTCMRIMKDLAEMGYLEQTGPRKGYVPGPIAFYSSEGIHPRQVLFQAAAPEIDACARKIGQSVMLAVRYNTVRHIPCHYNYNMQMQINCAPPRHDDLYVTASGRILMAGMSERELTTFLERRGMPSEEEWPAAAMSRDALTDELCRIREAGQIGWEPGMSRLIDLIAFPLLDRGNIVAAVGASWPAAESERLRSQCIEAVKLCTEQISSKLNFNIAGG